MATPIIINQWTQGIATSQATGIASMRSLDISTYPGIVRPNTILEKNSSTTITAQPTWNAFDPITGYIYVVDSSNHVYRSNSSGVWTDVTTINATTRTTGTGAGQGIIVYKNYLWAFRNTAVDLLGPLNGVPVWTNGWGGLTLTTDSLFHPSLVGQDDILYIGGGRIVSSVYENSGTTFDPTNAATYTATASALDLPSGYRIKCMAELGVNLMIGTWQGSNIYDIKIADIFPWDRSSPSFDIPLRLSENGISQMINKDNVLYIQAGTSGRIFATNGSSIRQVAVIPNYVSNLDGGVYFNPQPCAIMVHLGRIFFGISRGTSGAAGGGNGVWSYNPDTNTLNWENIISTLNTQNIDICGLFSVSRDTYVVFWKDSTAVEQGVDRITNSSRSLTGILESQAYRVGTNQTPATYQNIICELAKPLSSGEQVLVYARSGSSDSYGSAIASFTTSGIQSFSANANLKTKNTLQFKVELIGSASATSGPNLLELRIE